MKTYTIDEATHHIYTVSIEHHNDFRGEINGRAVECIFRHWLKGAGYSEAYSIAVNGHYAPEDCYTDSEICYTLRNLLGDGANYDNL